MFNAFKLRDILFNNPSHPAIDAEKHEALLQLVELANVSERYPLAFFDVFAFSVKDSDYDYDAWKSQWVLGETIVSEKALLAEFEVACGLVCPLSKASWKQNMSVLRAELAINPGKRYLNRLTVTKDGWKGWDTLAKDVLGVTDKTSQDMLTHWLLGAVYRAMEPGCQMRQCLVLQGQQGIGKTEFARILGGSVYSHIVNWMSPTDRCRQLDTAWISELEYLESFYWSAPKMKSFITATGDETNPRHCALIGTVNKTNFLKPKKDNSHFWVIAVPEAIHIGYLKEHRDEIWAEAKRRYYLGQPHWSEELEKKAVEVAKSFIV